MRSTPGLPHSAPGLPHSAFGLPHSALDHLHSASDLVRSASAGAGWVATLLDKPLRVLLILIGGWLLRLISHRLIDRIAEGIATGRAGLTRLDERLPTATALLSTSPLLSARREQRARTTASLLKSATTAAVATMAALTALGTLKVEIAPLLTSVGVIGVALGLGAQAVIKDVLAGLFIIVEDQYGVGDVVDLGPANGMVEAVGLRVTRLRDENGTVWYLRNGEISRVGNRSQGWSRAVLDVALAHDQDVAKAQAILLEVANDLAKDEEFAGKVLDEPQVWGLESVTKDAMAIRLVVKTRPLQQWSVARELRRRILAAFRAENLPLPLGLDPTPTLPPA